MQPIIEVKGLSKRYRIGEKQPYYSFRDTLADLAKAPFKQKNKVKNNTFWALKDISFKVMPGEVIGIIGRNGAGKSTLLKILSRITPPTKGEVTLRGRVASLLEVGTGFHPELTGRENIYLNGAILGMKRTEINDKFDEIVDFAEISKFLDTPVKFYSSGMYMRLAFAIAAHLDPEILLVDEVLAVGDIEFQKKCLGKMKDVSKQGRTVLFVSHNMNAVEQLCNRCFLIDEGNLQKDSNNVRTVTKTYLFGEKLDKNFSEWINTNNDYINQWVKPVKIFVEDSKQGKINMPISNNNDIWLNMEIEIKEFDPALQIGYGIYNEENYLLYCSFHNDIEEKFWPVLKKGRYVFKTKISKRFLNEGKYRIELLASLYYRSWIFEPGRNGPSITIVIQGGLSDSPYWMIRRLGALAPVNKWKVSKQ